MSAENTKRLNINTVIFPITLLAVFTLAYWAIFQKMSIRWSNGDNNYCYLVIPLFAYLLWDRRNKPSADGGQRLQVGDRKDKRLENQNLRRLESEQVELTFRA